MIGWARDRRTAYTEQVEGGNDSMFRLVAWSQGVILISRDCVCILVFLVLHYGCGGAIQGSGSGDKPCATTRYPDIGSACLR